MVETSTRTEGTIRSLRRLRLPGQRVHVEIVGVEGDFVASIVGNQDVEDIFGAGPSRDEAFDDLRSVLKESRENLAGLGERLSPRLSSQLHALSKLLDPSETAPED